MLENLLINLLNYFHKCIEIKIYLRQKKEHSNTNSSMHTFQIEIQRTLTAQINMNFTFCEKIN